MAKQKPVRVVWEYYSCGTFLEQATRKNLGHTKTFHHTVYSDGSETVEVSGEDTIKDFERIKRKIEAHLGEAASEIYTQRPEAFGG